ncbi:hypothetical protein JCM18899A_20120 [Nocardioides sp. AN3]
MEPHRAGATENRPPGPQVGAVLGAAGGLLLAGVWAFGAWDVALALTAVFACLVVALALGAPGWRPFDLALLLGAIAVAGVIALFR